jgi:transposase
VIGTTRQVRVHVYSEPMDMRRGFDGLHAVVTGQMGADALSGDMFLFVNRSRRRAKVLFWDGTGLCVFAKRLERGRFAAPWNHKGDGPLRLTTSELALFLEGSQFVGLVPLSPEPFSPGAMATATG